MQALAENDPRSRVAKPGGQADLLDLRFRALLPDADWNALSPAIRHRFAKRLSTGASAVYVGRITACEMNLAGWLLAQAARLVGGPLPISRAVGLASVVTVTEDPDGGGQTWTRLYVRASGFPQVIHSAKRFAGPTGLEEHVGAGIGMSLTVGVEDDALVFRSHGYFVDLFGARWRVPVRLSPGALTVTHAETGPLAFRFRLHLRHPLFGRLIRQDAEFHDSAPVEETLS